MEINIWIVAAQIINFLILFFVFKHFVWDKLSASLEERRKTLSQAQEAELNHAKIVEQAEKDRAQIIDDALAHKQQLIQQSEAAATLKAEKILADAKITASSIEEKAKQEANKLQSDLKDSYVSWVKKISQLVLKKIIWKDSDIQDSYIQEVMKQVS